MQINKNWKNKGKRREQPLRLQRFPCSAFSPGNNAEMKFVYHLLPWQIQTRKTKIQDLRIDCWYIPSKCSHGERDKSENAAKQEETNGNPLRMKIINNADTKDEDGCDDADNGDHLKRQPGHRVRGGREP